MSGALAYRMGRRRLRDVDQRPDLGLQQHLHLTTELKQGIAILRMSAQELSEYARKCVEELFGGDWYRYTDAYYDQVAFLPERTGCDWIGHFDLVTKFNERAPAFDEESPRYLRRRWRSWSTWSALVRRLRSIPGPWPGDTGPLPILRKNFCALRELAGRSS